MLKKRSLSIEPFYYWWQDRVFIAAIILAILLHIFVLLIHFAMPAPSEQSTKEIAISIRPTEDVIKHADFLAQADQQGSGAFR
ncbi:energy transducer TonB, partial [Acinetobacter baumannii]